MIRNLSIFRKVWQDKAKGLKDVISKIKEEKDRLEKQDHKLAKFPLTKSNQLSTSSDILV